MKNILFLSTNDINKCKTSLSLLSANIFNLLNNTKINNIHVNLNKNTKYDLVIIINNNGFKMLNKREIKYLLDNISNRISITISDSRCNIETKNLCINKYLSSPISESFNYMPDHKLLKPLKPENNILNIMLGLKYDNNLKILIKTSKYQKIFNDVIKFTLNDSIEINLYQDCDKTNHSKGYNKFNSNYTDYEYITCDLLEKYNLYNKLDLFIIVDIYDICQLLNLTMANVLIIAKKWHIPKKYVELCEIYEYEDNIDWDLVKKTRITHNPRKKLLELNYTMEHNSTIIYNKILEFI